MGETETTRILNSTDKCQEELHKRGEANHVSFDPTKESKHILSLTEPHGTSFKVLGLTWDTALSMKEAVDELVTAANWKT